MVRRYTHAALILFIETVLRFCQTNNASITSWYRTLAHNAQVGGVDGSYHLEALAIDIVFDHWPHQTDQDNMAAYFAQYNIEIIFTHSHAHVEPAPSFDLMLDDLSQIPLLTTTRDPGCPSPRHDRRKQPLLLIDDDPPDAAA